MLYIVEGPDKCGKSTFIEKHNPTHHFEGIKDFIAGAQDLNRNHRVVVHFDETDINPVESLRICSAFSHVCDVFMDRSWISDMVYGVVYRGEMRLEPRDDQYIVGMLQETPHIIYYFDKPIANLDPQDKFEANKELTDLVKLRYRQIMARYKKTLNIYRMEAMI